MKKKWLTAGAGLGIGAVLFMASGISAMEDTSGYDAYKTALQNTKAKTSMTVNVDLTVMDNGKKLVEGTADLKVNKNQRAGSVAATIGDTTETRSINVFRQEGKVVFKNSEDDVYKVKELNNPKWQHHGDPQGPPKAVEQVFGALFGNIKELSTIENKANYSKHVELHLSGDQVPAVVNAVGTMAVSKIGNHPNSENTPDWMANMPKLTDKIKVDKIDLEAEISPNNVLEEQSAKIKIIGTDDSGKKHDLTINIDIDYTDFNKTVPETVDLTDKKIEEIKKDGITRRWRH
ncbi:hypothetical protein P9E76_11645 [Schinkia azotoformans]|uniref:Uncharacterized protein n=1 Tax=Schinkia azotoformans LMG 9581 TaxID=1131731 RepID=K6E5W5_SCHAZ|nr:hypothetical protein [Schinkia azotoformans]EKN68661.1 hypothetical protein BAZO_03360 [Schinkia azotoformans LMG 9581]MEC1640731.1 hypothetical protein [Schinkia azotoformans]MEC1945697.1 hypothetical protein [Schinkia azotoformans]